jgi:hypothetical protein
MSDAFYEYLSDEVRALCRLCDKCTGVLSFNIFNVLLWSSLFVTVKGSVAPMSFYTYDVNPYPILPSLPKNGSFWDIFPPTTTVEYDFDSIVFLVKPFQKSQYSGIVRNLVLVFKRISMVSGQNQDRF